MDGPLASPILTVGLPGNITSSQVATALFEKHKIIVKVTGRTVFPEEGGPTMPLQATRFSFHLFNDLDEVSTMCQRFGEIVKELLLTA